MRLIARLLPIILLLALGLAQPAAATHKGEDHGQHTSEDGDEHGRDDRDRDDPNDGGDDDSRTDSSSADDDGSDDQDGQRRAQASPSPRPSPSESGEETGGPPTDAAALRVTTSASKVLVEVGDRLDYVVTVENSSESALEDVTVVDLVPDELDVTSVDTSHEDVAVQLGRSPRGEDVVWIIETLGAGEAKTFTWKAQAVAPGDLIATNEVSATAVGGAKSQDTAMTFLGHDAGVVASNPPARPVVKKVVVLGTRIVRAPATGGVLPVTGAETRGYIAGGFALGALGIYLLMLAGSPAARRRARAGAIALLLVMTACTATTEPEPEAAPTEAASPEDEKEPKDEPKDRVKGIRIERGDDDTEQPAPEESPAAVAELPAAEPEPVVETVRKVKTVVVQPEDMPVETQGSRDGDNAMSLGWDLDARTITYATSGIRFVPGATSELMTSLDVAQQVVSATVVLRNLSEDTRVAVSGRILHTVSGGQGVVTTFESDRLDIVLTPGGEVEASFSYLLPTGDYSVSSEFVAD